MKRTLSIILTLVMAVSMLSAFSVSAATPLIKTPEELLAISESPSGSYKLGADIDMSAYPLSAPIADTFSGTLDGNGYTIKNLKINSSGKNTGLFNKVTGTVCNIYIKGSITVNSEQTVYIGTVSAMLDGGTIERVVTDMSITVSANGAWIGGITGYLSGKAVIENCQVNGKIVSSSKAGGAFLRTGGIAAGLQSYGARIMNCTNNADIESTAQNASELLASGILAFSTFQSEITSCKNTGDITVSSSGATYAGGISAITANYTSINRSENRGNISAAINGSGYEAKAGGIVADVSGQESGGSLSNCANFGSVSADTFAGGIAGHFNGRALKNNFASPDAVITSENPGTLCGAISHSTVNENNYFEKQSAYAGFDFESIWKMGTKYPELKSAGAVKAPAKPVITPAVLTFRDVKKSDWFYDKVQYAVTHGIFAGKSAEYFEPEDNMTRAEFVQVLANLEKVDTSNKKVTTAFSDVKSGAWYAPAVKWASDNKIVGGMGNGTFAPEKPISRQEMCVMLINYTSYKGIDLREVEAKTLFKDDAKIQSWAKAKVYECQTADIVNGKGGGVFDPEATALRSEVASLFKNFHENYIG